MLDPKWTTVMHTIHIQGMGWHVIPWGMQMTHKIPAHPPKQGVHFIMLLSHKCDVQHVSDSHNDVPSLPPDAS